MDEVKEWWEEHHKKFDSVGDSHFLAGSPYKYEQEQLCIDDSYINEKNVLVVGVGIGLFVMNAFKVASNVQAVDISPVALQRIAKHASKTYLPENLSNIPDNHFDLAISYLVTQHMNDENILTQFENVFRSLKDNGVFAVQFADSNNYVTTELAQRHGGCCRTFEMASELIENSGGRIDKDFRYPVKDNVDFIVFHCKAKR